MKFILLFASFLVTCMQVPADSSMIVSADAEGSMYTFLSLGDSYTIGESAPESSCWSVQLAELLRKKGIYIANPDIIARTGWTTSELQNAIQANGTQKTYSLVSLLIGVNNQYRGQSQDQYRTEFNALLKTAIHFADNRANHVFVLSIPDWGASPYADGRDKTQIMREIDQFNSIAEEQCRKAGITYIDITSLTRSAAGDSAQFTSDGLHYSGKQMRMWAEKSLPVVIEMLQR